MPKVFSFYNFLPGKGLDSAKASLIVLLSLSTSGCAKAILNRPVNRTIAANFKIITIHPHYGSTAGGSTVVITGSGFSAFGATVDIGGAACINVQMVSANTIRCTTTAHAAGLTNLTVVNADLVSTSAANVFTYTPGEVNFGFAVTSGGYFGLDQTAGAIYRQSSIGVVLMPNAATPSWTSVTSGAGMQKVDGLQGVLRR